MHQKVPKRPIDDQAVLTNHRFDPLPKFLSKGGATRGRHGAQLPFVVPPGERVVQKRIQITEDRPMGFLKHLHAGQARILEDSNPAGRGLRRPPPLGLREDFARLDEAIDIGSQDRRSTVFQDFPERHGRRLRGIPCAEDGSSPWT